MITFAKRYRCIKQNKTQNIRTIKLIIDLINKSIKWKPEKFKIFENGDGRLNFLGPSNRTKKFVIITLKHYANLNVKNTNLSSQLYEKLKSILHENGPKKVRTTAISS